MTSGDLRMVVPIAADLDGDTRLVDSSACHFGSGGAGGAMTLAAGARAVTSAPAAAGSPSPPSARGGGPATSCVSYLMTSTGHPSAATMIDGVNGFKKSGL